MRCLVLAAATALWPGLAVAEDCAHQVERFAAELGLRADLPQARADQDSTTAPALPSQQPRPSDLAESGGVLSPPDTGADMPTLEPPPGSGANMPTAPEIAPDTGGTSASEQSARDAQIQALLVAARHAAKSGNNQLCLYRLQRAVAIASANAG